LINLGYGGQGVAEQDKLVNVTILKTYCAIRLAGVYSERKSALF